VNTEATTPEEFWRQWNRFGKVTFDGKSRLITINPYVSELSVREDIYSPWKRWVVQESNIRHDFALRATGGSHVGSGFNLTETFFLINGWRIKCDWANYPIVHMVSVGTAIPQPRTLSITGNIFVDAPDTDASIFAV